VGDDFDVGSGDMGVTLDEVRAEGRGVEFGRSDGGFFSFDVNRVLNRVGGYDNAVICFGIAAKEIISKLEIGEDRGR